MISKIRCLSFSLLSVILFAGNSAAETNPLIYYILDGSGSMWGRVEGRTKIEAAKDIMSKLIADTPGNVHVGLMAYGHRRRADCSDIEVLFPPAPADKEALTRAVRSITPRGMTPLTNSVVQAVESVKGSENAATVALVSDGIETCEKDPCTAVRALKDSGVNFVLHVVGFGVSGGAEKELRCMAEASGGTYFSTKNAGELLSALNAIQKSAVEKKPLAAPTALPTPKEIVQELSTQSSSLRIKVQGPGTIALKRDSWLKAPYYWKLISPETGEEKAKFNSLDNQFVPAGEYQLVWRQSEHSSREVTLGEVFSVESGKTTEVALRTALRLVLPKWVKEPRFWGLRRAGSTELEASFQALEPQLVPAGQYELIWQQSEHGSNALALGTIDIKEDIVNDFELSTAVMLVPANWIPEPPYYWELRKPEDGTQTLRFSLGFEPQLVAAGTYSLIYRQSQHQSSDSYLGEVEITQGKLTEFALNTGVAFVAKEGTPVPYRITFEPLENPAKEAKAVVFSETFGPMLLSPGKYKIIYQQTQHGSAPMTLVESFELPAGNLVQIEM